MSNKIKLKKKKKKVLEWNSKQTNLSGCFYHGHVFSDISDI